MKNWRRWLEEKVGEERERRKIRVVSAAAAAAERTVARRLLQLEIQ